MRLAKRFLFHASFFAVSLALALSCALPATGSGQEPDAKNSNAATDADHTDDRPIWLGELDAGLARLRLQLSFEKNAEGDWTGEVISLDQNNAKMPITEMSIDDDSGHVVFKIKSVFVTFEGDFNEQRNEIKGTWKQGPRSLPLTFRKVDRIPERHHMETWTGTLKAGAREFPFQLRIFEDDAGERTAVLDSFAENMMGLPIELAEPDADEPRKFGFRLAISNAKYEGEISEDGDVIKGTWKQNGLELPLEFKKIPIEETRVPSTKRPQTPKPPFDYESVELTIPSPYDPDVKLAGTLTLPKGEGPFPLVIPISGSGPQDRDETIYGHKPFFVLADHLAKHGIATFRYDERGIGKSTGDFANATSEDFARDVEAIIDNLKKDQRIDSRWIFLVGHSEGGYVAPMVASRRDDVAGIILLAGSGVPGRQIVLDQTRRIAQAAGADEGALADQETLLKTAFELIESGEVNDDQFVDVLIEKTRERLPEDRREQFRIPPIAKVTLSQLNSPWFRFFLDYDPATALSKVKVPVLVLFGDKDLQVHPDLNVPPIREALKNNHHPATQVKILPGLNHLFQPSETGSPTEYVQIETTIDPVVLKEISDWIQQVMQSEE